jgi:hypothetical protein
MTLRRESHRAAGTRHDVAGSRVECRADARGRYCVMRHTWPVPTEVLFTVT